MFTEGSDNNALKWVKEGSNNPKKEVPYIVPDQRPQINPISSRNGAQAFGLPPTSKFRSGHLSGVIPHEDNNSHSENDMSMDSDEEVSENDLSTDSDEEVFGGGYSLDSPPQDNRIPPSNNSFYDPAHMRPQYQLYSSDVSSSIETMGGRVRGNVVDRKSVYTSRGGNTELSTTQVPSRVSGHISVKDHEAFDEHTPSAPPFLNSDGPIKQEEHQQPSNPSHTSLRSNSCDFEAKPTIERKAPSVYLNHKNDTLKLSNGNLRPECVPSSGSFHARLPTFHASSRGRWHSVIAYDACVRLCLRASAKGCMEAPKFLENECALLRSTFNVQHLLLQSEEELLVKRSSKGGSKGGVPKPKKIVGKMKVQVREVRETVKRHFSTAQSKVSSGWQAVRRAFSPRKPVDGSVSHKSLPSMQASTQYIKQETYSCWLRLKSSGEDDTVGMQPGSIETHIFLPDSLGDVLILEVHDSKRTHFGQVLIKVADISNYLNEKLRWWPIYRNHKLVGQIQLYINYTSLDGSLKRPSARRVAYDIVMEVAMKVQNFHQRSLHLQNPWKWLLIEFASYYGVSDAYTKLRYLSYIMDVATPTADCLSLVYDLLLPVVMKGRSKSTLSHQENRILGEIEEQIEQILAVVFENYKSLDENSPSGMMDVFRPATGVAPSVLEHAVKLFKLTNDILSPEAQDKLYSYFQTAAKKRSRQHLTETDEYISGNGEGIWMDPVAASMAYWKMTSLCLNIRNEIFRDIEIHNCNILPSSIDLQKLSSAIYSAELSSRLRAFLVACPPTAPSPHVTDLVVATADFQNDLAAWKINPAENWVDAKQLFHLYIMKWIEDKRLHLLETCKLNKVKWSGARTPRSTTPFVDEMCEQLEKTLKDYEVIICRWPDYTFTLENAVADIEKAVIKALDKQYADVVVPLKKYMTPKKLRLKSVQKLIKRTTTPYIAPLELGVLLNSMKRMLDDLARKIKLLKSVKRMLPRKTNLQGEPLGDVTVMLQLKFREYLKAVVEKLVKNTRLQNGTKLKKILQDSKESVGESEIRSRMQPLIEQLTNTMNDLHKIFETRVFIATCRWYWGRMGKDVLIFLTDRKENPSWYKGSRVTVSILDDTFTSHMQQLLGNTLQEKDLKPPSSIRNVRSMLCNDAGSYKNDTFRGGGRGD